MDIHAIWDKANSLRGCLSHLRTDTGRRKFDEDEDPLTVDLFISDKAKLLMSKAHRTMAHKTQVFTWPDNVLTRTRQIHVNEVVSCTTVTANLLGLNTDLAEAAAIGHDIGHVPYGHQGESWMAQQMGKPAFCHEIMGPIIVQRIERRGKGLNLTFETMEGMLCHSGQKAHADMTPEAWVLRYCDKIAYLFADYNDIFIRRNYPISKGLQAMFNRFGSTQRERATTAIAALIIESAEKKRVSFQDSEFAIAFNEIRKAMYDVYQKVTQQNVGSLMGPVYEFLDNQNVGDPWLLLALMNDKDIRFIHQHEMKDYDLINHIALKELIPYLSDIGPIDLCDHGLQWGNPNL